MCENIGLQLDIIHDHFDRLDEFVKLNESRWMIVFVLAHLYGAALPLLLDFIAIVDQLQKMYFLHQNEAFFFVEAGGTTTQTNQREEQIIPNYWRPI